MGFLTARHNLRLIAALAALYAFALQGFLGAAASAFTHPAGICSPTDAPFSDAPSPPAGHDACCLSACSGLAGFAITPAPPGYAVVAPGDGTRLAISGAPSPVHPSSAAPPPA